MTDTSNSPMRVKLSDERKGEILRELTDLYSREFDEELTPFRAEQILAFFIKSLGPPVYNQAASGIGAGIHRVKVGDRAYTCLRVMEIDEGMPDVLDVAFITRNGRVVLHRRYEEEHVVPDRDYMRNCDTLSEAYPDNPRIVLDGKTFVVWYEVIAAFAFGIAIK